ncbi:hypothetical protein EIP91_003383 [Steccherinum ochraceum]|uniref:Uncharacterized protein n=1 Tax=Steccherinum ochraceum TaxID=92696 RepID=A0A4R0RAK2_9APHY|nr:hypothetical protein EIP91_003383 [Steccherinum ochraceum]
MHIPRAVVAASAILYTRDSSITGSLTNVANSVEGLVTTSGNILSDLSDQLLFPSNGLPSWNDVQLSNNLPGIAATNDAKSLATFADGYLSMLSSVLGAGSQSARVSTINDYQTSLNSFAFTYPSAFSDFENTVSGVIPTYDGLFNNSIASLSSQQGQVQGNIDTLNHNLKIDDVNIAAIAIEAGLTGFALAATAAEDEAELAELIQKEGIELGQDFADQINDAINQRQSDEDSLSDWNESKQALVDRLADLRVLIATVHGYPTSIAAAKTTTDFLSSYYNGLKRDTASVLQWAQNDAQGGASDMPAILSQFKTTGSCFYTGDKDTLNNWAQDTWTWLESQI